MMDTKSVIILIDVLSDESLIHSVLKEIQDNWAKNNLTTQVQAESLVKEPGLDISDQLHKIMEEKMSNFSVQKTEKTDEEKKLKAAIMASYAVEEGEEDDDESDDDDGDIGSNANVEAVKQVIPQFMGI